MQEVTHGKSRHDFFDDTSCRWASIEQVNNGWRIETFTYHLFNFANGLVDRKFFNLRRSMVRLTELEAQTIAQSYVHSGEQPPSLLA